MKTTRVFASASLLISSVALIVVTSISGRGETGVARLSSYSPQVGGEVQGFAPAPVPDGSGYVEGPGVVYEAPMGAPGGYPMDGTYPQPSEYAPYFDQSFGATEMVPGAMMQGQQPFGPLLMFEQNLDDGLGYSKGYSRLNARIPYHLLPNTTVLMGDVSASVTSNGDPMYNYGVVYRNYDQYRNRIFGLNAFGDYDQGYGNKDWNRVSVGFESLGKYIDWRANGYRIVGDDSVLLSSTLTGNPFFLGTGVSKNRQRVWDNAYSGFDLETGGPLPIFGRYGLNMYVGGYYLGNDNGFDTAGFQARWQALVTESLSVNTYLTTDDTFGTNSWVSLSYTIPNYRNRRILRPTEVRERLQDPVVRSNRIHTNIDTTNDNEALLNKNGLAYTLIHVNPNATAAGDGSFENPFNTFQQAADNNNALVDTIRVIPRSDDTGTNLTANGGITLFDCQTLMSSTQALTFTDFGGTVNTIAGIPTTSNLGALISNPTMVAGGSVVRLADQNTVLGMRIDASNTANTVFGNAILNTAPITDVTLASNTLTDYVTGANLQNVNGRVVITGNAFTGRAGTSVSGLNLSSAAGSTSNLLVRQNTATTNSGTGLSIVAKNGSTINASNPDSVTTPTGVLDNTTTGNGTGILMEARPGATINAVVEGNTSTGNTVDGFVGRSDGGIFRLASLSGNQFNSNAHHGAYIHYLNNGLFTAVSEDADRDGNLDAGEDLNGNGRLDRGIVQNNFNNNLAAGMCIFGEDAVDNGAAGAGAPDALGRFDIGDGAGAIGATGSGNNFFGNGSAGIAYDLTGFATGQINALNNSIGPSVGASTADGIVLRGQGNSVFLASDINNNRIDRNGRWGIDVEMLGSARANDLDLKANTVTNNGLGGVRLHTDGPGAFIDASQTIGGAGTVNLGYGNIVSAANQFSNNSGDGLRIQAENGSVIRGNVINNQIRNNTGNGISMIADRGANLDFGTTVAPPASRVISGNTISGNDGAGIQLTSNVTATTVNRVDATVRGNTISGNDRGGVMSVQSGTNTNAPVAPAVSNNTVNLNVGGTATADANTITGNGDAGVGVSVAGNGIANVTIRNATITGTTNGPDPILNGDGINLRRADSSLLTATIEDLTATGNAGDGLDVEVTGNDKNDPNQPLPGTRNTVTWNRNNLSTNGQNGARFRTRAESMLIADGATNTLSGNAANGILIQTSENSSFGDPTDGLAPGRRVNLDGNVVNGNTGDGIQIVASDNSRALVNVTSTAIPAVPGPHLALAAQGNTSISNNGRDGVRVTSTGGRSDIVVTSGTGQTTISGNGTAGGGNGIRLDASGTTDSSLQVTKTIIRSSIAGVTETIANNGNGGLDAGEDLNGNGTLDPGEDTNSNDDIDVVDGDGIQANFHDNATATLIIGGAAVTDRNLIQSNADDGIAITATGHEGELLGPPAEIPRPVITIRNNVIGGENNGVAAGNGGDGISVNLLGGADVGIEPGNVDFTTSVPPDFSDTTVSSGFGETEAGAIPQITISNNTITNNTGRGVNVLLTGAGGTRDREFFAATFDPIRISLTDNNISSNGEEGVYYRADSDMNQSRFVFLPNFPDPPVTGLDNQNYSPFRAEFLALNVFSVNGNAAYMAPYLNLRTVQNSYLTVTGNRIQNNGKGGTTGEGLLIKVGTGSYVAADVQNNTFGGNLEEDFRTSSFLSAVNTFDSVDNTGDGTRDFVYLDDTAQLDVRFNNNSGNQIDAFSGGDAEIAAEALGATYTNADPLKTQFFGGINVLRRQADLFQVENGPNLNATNPFVNFGIVQNVNDNFSRLGTNYNVRGAADPLFPNIGFAPFLP